DLRRRTHPRAGRNGGSAAFRRRPARASTLISSGFPPGRRSWAAWRELACRGNAGAVETMTPSQVLGGTRPETALVGCTREGWCFVLTTNTALPGLRMVPRFSDRLPVVTD